MFSQDGVYCALDSQQYESLRRNVSCTLCSAHCVNLKFHGFLQCAEDGVDHLSRCQPHVFEGVDFIFILDVVELQPPLVHVHTHA